LEGLEVSIIPSSVVLGENQIQRLDAKYFAKNALAAEIAIKAGDWTTLGEVSSRIESFGAYALNNEFEYQEEGIPFLRCVNIKSGFVDFGDSLFIDETAHKLLSKSAVKAGMVLITMSGRVGDCAVALDHWNYPINSNQDIAKLTPRGVDPFYLTAFLSSSVGVAQIERMPIGSIQQHIFLWMIEKILIRRFGIELENRIADTVKAAYSLFAANEVKQTQAEAALLDALGLAGWTPPEPLTYTARAADALSAARLDAQYFRPKYDEALALLTAKGNAAELGTLVKLNSRGRQPIYADAGLPVINSKHVRTNTVNLGEDNRFGETGRSPIVIKPGDVLLNGTGVGTIGRAAPYLFDHDALPDNHVTVIRPDGIDPIYLSVFLNSTLGQLQIEQLIKGSSGQIELYPDDIAKIIVWDAPDGVQTVVRDAVLSAKALEARSRALLASAKRAVEIAIEDGEAVALAFLNASSL
jgi:restriction endonuclease S subunit